MMATYTEQQVRSILLALLLGVSFPFEDEMIPVHDVSVKQVSEEYVQVNIGMDGYKEACYTLPVSASPTTTQDYTQDVLRTYAGQETQKEKLTLGALGLAGEAGEIIDPIKKYLYQGHDIDATHLLDEIGDVLWYLALMCSAFGWTLHDAMQLNMVKLHERYPHGFEAARSIQRDNGKE